MGAGTVLGFWSASAMGRSVMKSSVRDGRRRLNAPLIAAISALRNAGVGGKRRQRYTVIRSSHHPESRGPGAHAAQQEAVLAREVVIVNAVRTGMGRRNGMLSQTHPVSMAGKVLRAVVDQVGV